MRGCTCTYRCQYYQEIIEVVEFTLRITEDNSYRKIKSIKFLFNLY